MSSGERMKAKPLLTKAVQNAKLREHNGQSSLRYRMNLLVKEIGATFTYGETCDSQFTSIPWCRKRNESSRFLPVPKTKAIMIRAPTKEKDYSQNYEA